MIFNDIFHFNCSVLYHIITNEMVDGEYNESYLLKRVQEPQIMQNIVHYGCKHRRGKKKIVFFNKTVFLLLKTFDTK